MNWTAFALALAHAALGGAVAGVAAAGAGASWETIGFAAAGSAISSVLSFLAQSPLGPQAAAALAPKENKQ